MSDEKRRSVRTQNRFSCDKEASSSRKEKRKGPKKSLKEGEKVTKDTAGVKAAIDGVSVEYQEDSTYSFKELEKKKPEELKISGFHDLSKTENGISRLIYCADFLPQVQAEELMNMLSNTTKWHDKNIVIRGEEYPQPRLVAWYGPFPYTYSGATLEAAEMPRTVVEIKMRVEAFSKENDMDVKFNSVLLNLYRNEKDSVAWHSDDELTMGVAPTIASVSLGAVRKFEMRPKSHTIEQNDDFAEDSIFYVNLTPGSLIIMNGCMQEDWQHRVPKEFHDRKPRINLTFRTVHKIEQSSTAMSYCKVKQSSKTPASQKSAEASLDLESFPPLMSASQKNGTVFENEVSCDASADHEVSSTSSSMIFSYDENENQNNLNKDLNYCTSEDSSHYNLMEPEKSSDNLVNKVSEETNSNNNLSTTESCSANGTKQAVSSTDNSNKPEVFGITNKSQLNINAPDFVPKSNIVDQPNFAYEPIYSSYSFVEIAEYFESNSLSPQEIMDLLQFVFNKIDKAFKDCLQFFLTRDWYELETLKKLYDVGQTAECQNIILQRICSIINKCNHEMRSPHRYSGARIGYSGDSYRNRNYSRSYNRN